ncbi:MAG TPA: carboxypeptidase-like regulatory domain-containing protein [Acidimicrobiales bacterium]|jgi:hypothetical protein|nr:carboxypeptidase-like regulatory domain-containing protein [Acidimicrobiales bacterium]
MRIHVFPEQLDLTPGEPASIQVDIFNDRDVIEGFVVSLVGIAAEILSVQPEELSLFPESGGSVTIVFSPSLQLAAGKRAAGVRVASTTDAALSEVVEVPITVAQRMAVALDVQPQTVTGGGRAHFGLVVENQGNAKISVTLAGKDPESALEFRMTPARVDVPPGGRKVCRAVASGKRPFVGTPVARVITFSGQGDGGRQETMATFIQRPFASRGALTFLALLAALAVWVLALFAGFDKLLAHQTAVTTNASKSTASTAAGGGAGAGAAGSGAGGAAGSASGAGGNGGAGAGGGTLQLSGTVEGAGVQVQAWVSSAPAVGAAATAGVAQAVVAVYPQKNPAQSAGSAVADASGAFTITGLMPGTYLLKASANGYETLWYPAAPSPAQASAITLAAGATPAPVAITLNGLPGSVAGTVQSVTGPVMGATVAVAGSNQAGVTTGADGTFKLDNLPTPATDQLTITKAGYPTATISITLNAGENLTGQQYLLSTQGGTVSGTVTDNQGVPLGGAKVTVVSASGAQLGSSTTMATGSVGYFVVANLPTPATDNVVISATGYISVTSQISLTAGMPALNLSPQLTPSPLTLSGTVSRAATPGDPCPPCTLPGVAVQVVGKTGAVTVTTADNGTYSVPNLLPGQYTVAFGVAGYATASLPVTLVPGQNRTESPALTAPAVPIVGADSCYQLAGSTTVTLTTAAGTAVAGVAKLTLPPGFQGGYTVTNVPSPGTYVLHFTFPTNAKTMETVTVAPGAPAVAGAMPCPGFTPATG